MNRPAFLEEIIKEKVTNYLNNSVTNRKINSTGDLKKMIESQEFQDFRRDLLQDLLCMVQNGDVNADEDDETLSVHTQISPSPEFEETRPSEHGSAISTTITQDLDCFYLTSNHLTDLAMALDPRVSNITKRREALRQIIGMPSVEAQVYEAWTVLPETPTSERLTFDGPDRSANGHSSDGTSSIYGIRQGLFDALADEDAELNLLSLKFISKAFSSASGSVKESYMLLVDYLEEQFTSNGNKIPFISCSFDFNNQEIARIIRPLGLLHEFHKKLPNFWLRYSEKLIESLMDRCLSLLAVGHSPLFEAHFESSENRLTPLHIISLFDPKAHWFSLWMRGAYGCRPLLNRLSKDKLIVSMWTTSCVNAFLRKPENSCESKKPDFYSSNHLKAAYFLHSLHALTVLLCFKETHSEIFPVNISKDVIKRLSEQDRASLVRGKALPIRTFMKLFVGFIISLRGSESAEEDALLKLVDNCFKRLALSPDASVLCFGLSLDESLPSVSKKTNKLSDNSNAFKDPEITVFDSMLTEIRLAVAGVIDTKKIDKDYAFSNNICILARALVSICSALQGQGNFSHSKVKRRNQAIAQILKTLLEFTSSDNFLIFSQKHEEMFRNLAELLGCICEVFSKTHLSIKRLYFRSDSDILRKVVDTLKILKAVRKDKFHTDLNIVKLFEDSLDSVLLTLLKSPKGIEFVESSDCIANLVQKYVCSNDSTISTLEIDLLVSQLASTENGFISLRRSAFIETRFAETWKLLEGSELGPPIIIESSQELKPLVKDSLGIESSSDHGAVTSIELNDDVIQNTFNRLISIFANFPSVYQALKEPLNWVESKENLQMAPKTLSDFIDRAIMLDSATKLAKLCRPEETLVFGLRFLSLLVSSLDIFLLLESRFGVRNMLISAQLRNEMDVGSGNTERFMIDEGFIERNRLLVKCSVLGGHNERFVPPRCLCEHTANPYWYPIISSLNSDSFEPFTHKFEQFCDRSPCVDDLDSIPVTSKRPQSVSFADIVLSSLKFSNASKSKGDCELLLKLPNIKSKINNLTKYLSQSNKQISDIGSLFNIRLRALCGKKQFVSSNVQQNATSQMLPAWKETAVSLVTDYGRRLNVLNADASYSVQKNNLTLLLTQIELFILSNKSPDKVNENKGGNEDSVEPFRTFDWFAALIFLVFRGDVSRTLEFLDRFRGSSLARYLWPSLDSSPSYQNTLCHTFETVFACELPQLYNTFLLSGYSPSMVLRHWLRQCFLNYLDWPEILDFLLLCQICGPTFIVFSAVAIMMHLSPRLKDSLQSQNHLITLLEKPITNFRLVDNLEFLESLAEKYGEELSAEMAFLSTAV